MHSKAEPPFFLLCCLIRIENNQVIVKIKGPLTAAVQR